MREVELQPWSTLKRSRSQPIGTHVILVNFMVYASRHDLG